MKLLQVMKGCLAVIDELTSLLEIVDNLEGDAGNFGQELIERLTNALAKVAFNIANADIGAMSESTVGEVIRSTL